MKANQSLTAAITAAALVIGTGFAYAQSVTTPDAAPSAQGTTTMQQTPSSSTDNSTTQAQPPSSSGTTMDNSNSTMQSGMTPMQPRADRN